MNALPRPGNQAVRRALVAFIARRYAQTAELPLPEDEQPSPRFMAVERRLLLFCQQYQSQVAEILRAEVEPDGGDGAGPLMQAMMTSTRRYIQRRNQFVALTQADQLALRTLYQQFLACLLLALDIDQERQGSNTPGQIGRRYGLALRQHYGRLQRFFAALDQRDVLQAEAICAEYSPDFQLSLLGLSPECMREPILDVGCGTSMRLVRYLRDLGLDAYGIDRDVRASHATRQSDWLRFDYEQRPWGTILSHMAFSTHFCFQHLNAQGAPQVYAQVLMRMLAALAPFGCLVYAPGLPFVEPLLVQQGYDVTRHALWNRAPEAAQALGSYAHLLGADPCYTAVVRNPRVSM